MKDLIRLINSEISKRELEINVLNDDELFGYSYFRSSDIPQIKDEIEKFRQCLKILQTCQIFESKY